MMYPWNLQNDGGGDLLTPRVHKAAWETNTSYRVEHHPSLSNNTACEIIRVTHCTCTDADNKRFTDSVSYERYYQARARYIFLSPCWARTERVHTASAGAWCVIQQLRGEATCCCMVSKMFASAKHDGYWAIRTTSDVQNGGNLLKIYQPMLKFAIKGNFEIVNRKCSL